VEFTSSSVKEVLGLNAAEDFTICHLLSIIHPEDQSYFYDFETRVTRFFNNLHPEHVLKYKVSYNYRMRRQDGKYINILQQVVTIQSDKDGAVIRVLGMHTDITHLNPEKGSTLSFIGLEGVPSYYDVSEGHAAYIPKNEILTRREKEVLEQLLLGKTSKEIAETLFIAKLTVDGHRKNLLKKANCSSTRELIMKAIQQQFQ
jgi:DNA-binding CsgD family transcriptional regulator